jgi:hypothetical protein
MTRVQILVLFAIPLWGVQASFAGHQVGNGGGAWVCRDRSPSREILKAELVDLFEATTEYYLSVSRSSEAWRVQVDSALDRVAIASPFFRKRLEPFVNDVLTRWPSTGASDLQQIDDSLHRRIPGREWCPEGNIEFGQVVNFTFQNTILVDFRIHEKLGPTDRAALIIHEAIYAMLRLYLDSQNSLYARKLVAYLFSELPPTEYRKLFEIEAYAQPAYTAPDMEIRRLSSTNRDEVLVLFPRHEVSGISIGARGDRDTSDGTCRALGYSESIPGSVRYDVKVWKDLLYFDRFGKVVEMSGGFPLVQIGCRDRLIPLILESSVLVRSPVSPLKRRHYPASTSGESVCRELGFDGFVRGSLKESENQRKPFVSELVCLRQKRSSPF